MDVPFQDAPRSAFSEARARALAEDFERGGPRPTGSLAELNAFGRIFSELESIKAAVEASDTSDVVVDVLRTSHTRGQFSLDVGAGGLLEHHAVYDGLTTVAARVRRKDWNVPRSNASRAVMVSVHVDTVKVSPGGSDNGANLGIALELVRNLAHGRESEGSTLLGENGAAVVMFSSAEEEGLMGAHGVITSHPWYPHVRCVLNLEAMGNGGRHRMFQTTRGYASNRYLKLWSDAVGKPSGSVLASDLFDLGIIKSDTDLRMFRDFGDTPGFDFAFLEQGHVYHTPNDRMSRVRPGSLQESGDNLLAFIRAFAEAPPLAYDGVAWRPGHPKLTGATWWAPPGAKAYIMWETLDPDLSRLIFPFGALLMLQVARAAYVSDTASPKDLARAMVAGPLAAIGAAAVLLGGAACGGASAVFAAFLAGTPTPWASQPVILVLLTYVPALLAQLILTRALRAALMALKGPTTTDNKRPAASEAPTKTSEKKKASADEGDAGSNVSETLVAGARMTAEEAADWSVLAGFVAVVIFLAGYMVKSSLGSAYIALVPAVFTSAMLLVVPVVWSLVRPTRGLGSFPAPTLIASAVVVPAYVAGVPWHVVCVRVLFGMAGRAGMGGDGGLLGPYFYDAFVGCFAGLGLMSVCFLLPTLMRRLVFGVVTKALFASWLLALTFTTLTSVPRTGSPWSAEYPQPLVMTTVVRQGQPPAVLVHGVGAARDLAAVAGAITSHAEKHVEGLAVNCSMGGAALTGFDLGTYAPTPACAVTSSRLAEEVREAEKYAAAAEEEASALAAAAETSSSASSRPAAVVIAAPTLEVRASAVDRSRRSSEGDIVPIDLDLGGARRWVVAVDRACVRRVAIAPGWHGPKTSSDAKPPPAADPAWRLTVRAASRVNDSTRYAVHGMGGQGAARRLVIWADMRRDTNRHGACKDAVVVRADHAAETETARAVRAALPEWTALFSKRQYPLDLAYVAAASLDGI